MVLEKVEGYTDKNGQYQKYGVPRIRFGIKYLDEKEIEYEAASDEINTFDTGKYPRHLLRVLEKGQMKPTDLDLTPTTYNKFEKITFKKGDMIKFVKKSFTNKDGEDVEFLVIKINDQDFIDATKFNKKVESNPEFDDVKVKEFYDRFKNDDPEKVKNLMYLLGCWFYNQHNDLAQRVYEKFDEYNKNGNQQ